MTQDSHQILASEKSFYNLLTNQNSGFDTFTFGKLKNQFNEITFLFIYLFYKEVNYD